MQPSSLKLVIINLTIILLYLYNVKCVLLFKEEIDTSYGIFLCNKNVFRVLRRLRLRFLRIFIRSYETNAVRIRLSVFDWTQEDYLKNILYLLLFYSNFLKFSHQVLNCWILKSNWYMVWYTHHITHESC